MRGGAFGFCQVHYKHLTKYGDPLAGPFRTTERGEPERFIEQALKFKGDACLIWPFGRAANGRAIIHDGLVHRLICKNVHGKPPTSEHEAAHNCGNGRSGCINPKHVYWATPKQNMEDRIRHGQAAKKLTPTKVRKIKKMLRSGDLQRVIAAKFGVHQVTIGEINRGEIWGWLA